MMNCEKLLIALIISGVFLIPSPAHTQESVEENRDSTKNVEIVDERMPGESTQHTLSLGIWDCEYMVTRISDKKMPIDRIGQFKNEMTSALVSLKYPQKIIVTKYAVYMNEGALIAAQAVAVAAASVGGVSVGQWRSAPRCAREKMRAGWYDTEEITTNKPPIIAEVTVKIGEKEYRARAAYSPQVGTGYYPNNARQLSDRIALYTKVNKLIIGQILADTNLK